MLGLRYPKKGERGVACGLQQLENQPSAAQDYMRGRLSSCGSPSRILMGALRQRCVAHDHGAAQPAVPARPLRANLLPLQPHAA